LSGEETFFTLWHFLRKTISSTILIISSKSLNDRILLANKGEKIVEYFQALAQLNQRSVFFLHNEI
jgi:uncharacterized protein (DUF1800 family)